MFRFQQAGCFCHLAARVLDRLGFIQDHIVEWHFHQHLDIASQCAVGCNHHVYLVKFFFHPGAIGPVMNMIGERGCEFFDLVLPVKH